VDIRVAGVCSLIVAAATAAAATAANPGPAPVNPGGPDMPATSVTLSTARAGAKPVALTLKVHYEMVCNQPGLGKALVQLPQASSVPAHIDSADVLVNGKPAPAVTVSGHDISITMPAKRSGVTCMVMGPGTLTLSLTRAAGLGNPAKAGAYTIRVRRNTQSFQAAVHISA
jgi:hypothetical protein